MKKLEFVTGIALAILMILIAGGGIIFWVEHIYNWTK